MKPRIVNLSRKTFETQIEVELNLDGRGDAKISTGIPFYDHLLNALTKHSHVDLKLDCKGDLEVDDHHTVEDCALVIGQAIDQALGERRGIARFGWAYAPLDESLARAVVDLSGRPWPKIELGLQREGLGNLACENVAHALRSLAIAMRANLHVQLLHGENDHHRAEAAFKSVALALRQAFKRQGEAIASTKGVL